MNGVLRRAQSNEAGFLKMGVSGQRVAIDGQTLQPSARYSADTINVGPGQRYDVIWLARQPGKWLIHCHIGHHTTNNNVETQSGGGLMMVIDVSPT